MTQVVSKKIRDFAAQLNASCDAARLNDPTNTVDNPHDPSKVQVSLIDAVRTLDDEARQRLAEAISHVQGSQSAG
jgi:hypothetical protein